MENGGTGERSLPKVSGKVSKQVILTELYSEGRVRVTQEGGQDVPGRGKKNIQAVLQNCVCLELSTFGFTKI